ncbi:MULTISPECIES: ATP-dependent protease subunit HslV [Psychrilyobacter]|uniref:ATP-dependent protease subunit HslV n=1 Tax=Psychrilyobacter piezotolerans TaxID=2293438 RepID=A0ABX9KKL6_9FUSO|nr:MULTISPECIES: ATP-dependent protease subunit HslV [Psychrilyobacter]MCS5421027.1 ATP-dependent protease subunit HslV [Psychrilyobacter sp. S5]NDI76306.1 ATP-dependent protease subunit HslV [Psychrilyobacter piezotolerans]RDE65905.1 ATP-dependent protease subunit HslV [Psychrilyobacter sp. S5]REI43083.1 ATP-dependent protease subunit HslV [Psychrilyobacter piezotolerans]
MKFRATTILAVKDGDRVAIAGDGQVTFGDTVFKNKAKKIRKFYNNSILAGFAGAAADAFALFDKFENKLDEYGGNLKKASVELAKEWRSDKALRELDAMLIVADKNNLLVLSGTGDVLETDDDIAAIGSGGTYAYAAAKALKRHTQLDPHEVVRESLQIAGEICIYTNTNISVEKLY